MEQVSEAREKTGDTKYFEVASGVWGMKIIFVNVYMISAGDDQWVLVDAGLPGSAGSIKKMASELFGDVPPAAIILTHAHFDHRGALDDLLKTWPEVTVYVHPMELPYLRGMSAYPPPDPKVGGGLMSLMSVLYPKRPLDLGERVQPLQENGSLPVLHDWLYVFTPGHTPGHISFFRSKDRVLIAGDAFVTTKQESAINAISYRKEISGPPKYFTPDWIASKESVQKLRDLHPAIAATGHGKPMSGPELAQGLDYLVANFDKVAVPSSGRYVKEPAKANKRGVQYIPKDTVSALAVASVVALAGVVTFIAFQRFKR